MASFKEVDTLRRILIRKIEFRAFPAKATMNLAIFNAACKLDIHPTKLDDRLGTAKLFVVPRADAFAKNETGFILKIRFLY